MHWLKKFPKGIIVWSKTSDPLKFIGLENMIDGEKSFPFYMRHICNIIAFTDLFNGIRNPY